MNDLIQPSAKAAVEVHEDLGAAPERELRAYLAAAAARHEVHTGHDPRWLLVLRDALRHRPFALVARRVDERSVPRPSEGLRKASADGDLICGYLPLALVATRLFGRFLVSLPYLDRAGLVADDDAAADALVRRAVALAAEMGAQYLELRHGETVTHPSLTAARGEKVRMVLPLPDDADALWKALDAKVRNQVRKGDKCGLTQRWGGPELLDDFYSVFAVNMRDLGTPVYPRRLFGEVLRRFADTAELSLVEIEGQPIAGALVLHLPAAGARPAWSQVPSASCLRQFNATSANTWMYHRLLVRTIERGGREFDFGRSSLDSGTYRFKKQWGARPRPTVWQYHVRHGDIDAVRPESPKYQRRIQAWQKLPVWVTRLVGPAIVRGIP